MCADLGIILFHPDYSGMTRGVALQNRDAVFFRHYHLNFFAARYGSQL